MCKSVCYTGASNNLYVGSLSGRTIETGKEDTMAATTVVSVTIGRTTETWTTDGPENNPADAIENYVINFTHNPEGETGLGATDSADGDTFLLKPLGGFCDTTGRIPWHSLIKTEGVYNSVYWYVKAPGDTRTYGTNGETDWGDGAEKQANLTHTFPADVDDTNIDGDQDGVYYEITAYVYKWDLSVYWESYKVFVTDAPRHD